jgi:hypothetical protein
MSLPTYIYTTIHFRVHFPFPKYVGAAKSHKEHIIVRMLHLELAESGRKRWKNKKYNFFE